MSQMKKIDSMAENGEQFRVSLSCTGIMNKCRKSRFTVIKLGYIQLPAKNLEHEIAAFREVAIARLKKNFRSVSSSHLHLDAIRLTVTPDCTIETWAPFDDNNYKIPLNYTQEIEK